MVFEPLTVGFSRFYLDTTVLVEHMEIISLEAEEITLEEFISLTAGRPFRRQTIEIELKSVSARFDFKIKPFQLSSPFSSDSLERHFQSHKTNLFLSKVEFNFIFDTNSLSITDTNLKPWRLGIY